MSNAIPATNKSDMQTQSCHPATSPFKESRPILFFFFTEGPSATTEKGKWLNDLAYYIPFYMNIDTEYNYHPKLKESTKKFPLTTSLSINGPNILCKLSYDIKLGIILFSVLNADGKASYFKGVWSYHFIQTVWNDVFNMYTVPFYNCIVKTQRVVSYPEHILNIQYLKEQI